MRPFEHYILESNEGGASAGLLEITKLSVEKARAYATAEFAKYGRLLSEEMPDHDHNFSIAKYRATLGHTKRRDMPVILPNDLRALQAALKAGSIDLTKPYAAGTDKNDPFPEGLSGADAEAFFTNGLKIHDGSEKDDRVGAKKIKAVVHKLIPIQEQIYYDKSINQMAKFGTKVSKKFHQETIFIASSDLRILDGHHRFISAIMVDPNQTVNILQIDLPFAKLLPLLLAFGDARGNKRNA